MFQIREIADIVIGKLLEYRNKRNYLLHESVLMPNHLHVILTPANSTTLEKAIQLIKGGSSHEIHKVRGGTSPIWQSGFHESRVRDWADYKKKADYVRLNPVAARFVERPEDWAFGSANGAYSLDAIPQGLKPRTLQLEDVGPEGPTPNALASKVSPDV